MTTRNSSKFHLDMAMSAVRLARKGDRNAATYWGMAARQLCKAIGSFNAERNRKGAGLALLALAKVRMQERHAAWLEHGWAA